MANADSPTKTCGEDGCGRPLRARGLCSTHYNQRHQPERHRKLQLPCDWCGRATEKEPCQGRNYGARFCSLACRDGWHCWQEHKNFTNVPSRHPAHPTQARRAAEVAARRAAVAELMEPRSCDDCGVVYSPGTTVQRYCTMRCARRVVKRARRAREAGASGSFTWTQVMGLFLLFDRRCAYCEQPIVGQPDPDHVIPLRRGGHNSIGNILPVCHLCNSDKGTWLLTEWNADRERRGLAPRVVEWSESDRRYAHLTVWPDAYAA